VTAVVTVPPLAVAVLPLLVAAVEITLRDETTGTNGIMIVPTGTMTAVTVIVSMIVVTAMIAAIVTASVLVTVPAAPRTGSAMLRRIVRDARMIANAVTRSVRLSRTVMIGKVCDDPAALVVCPFADKIDQYPWTPFPLPMMSLILPSRTALCDCHVFKPCSRVVDRCRSACSSQAEHGPLLTTSASWEQATYLAV
jgi:hypothetical protein